jgi:hypothetical protein
MATITITVPDAVVNRVLDAIAGVYQYNAVNDGTKAAFAKKQLGLWAKRTTREWEASQASNGAYTAAFNAAESDIVIT